MRKRVQQYTSHEAEAARALDRLAVERTNSEDQPNGVIDPYNAGHSSQREEPPGQLAAAPKALKRSVYLRSNGPELSASDVRDLETLMQMLRSYYEIPDDQPVFPKRTKPKASEKRAQPSSTAKNPSDHPWRGAA